MTKWYQTIQKQNERKGDVMDEVTLHLEEYLRGNKTPSIHGFAHYLNNELVAQELTKHRV